FLEAVTAAQTPFSLRGGSLAFSDRSHSIFDCLDTQLSSSSLKQDHITNKVFVQPHSSHPSRKTSLPPSTSPTPPKKRGVPDYLVHPERWTCYSLEDVPETSDQDNRRAAHQFLNTPRCVLCCTSLTVMSQCIVVHLYSTSLQPGEKWLVVKISG
uniref:U5 small nuclear ribonucleoprotein TSSC4 n=1 Tax=Anabas testudineus TaxID=64144 RepID=A0A3Q1I137_ANATE